MNKEEQLKIKKSGGILGFYSLKMNIVQANLHQYPVLNRDFQLCFKVQSDTNIRSSIATGAHITWSPARQRCWTSAAVLCTGTMLSTRTTQDISTSLPGTPEPEKHKLPRCSSVVVEVGVFASLWWGTLINRTLHHRHSIQTAGLHIHILIRRYKFWNIELFPSVKV